jgi:hypothetical protein
LTSSALARKPYLHQRWKDGITSAPGTITRYMRQSHFRAALTPHRRARLGWPRRGRRAGHDGWIHGASWSASSAVRKSWRPRRDRLDHGPSGDIADHYTHIDDEMIDPRAEMERVGDLTGCPVRSFAGEVGQ